MYPAQHRFPVRDISHHQRHMVVTIDDVLVSHDPEVAVIRGKFRFCFPLHDALTGKTVLNKVGDGDYRHIQFLCQFQDLCFAHHGSVIFHDFTAQAAFLQPSQTHQIHRGFGVSAPYQDTAVPGAERKHVSRPPEIRRFGIVHHTAQCRDRPLFR